MPFNWRLLGRTRRGLYVIPPPNTSTPAIVKDAGGAFYRRLERIRRKKPAARPGYSSSSGANNLTMLCGFVAMYAERLPAVEQFLESDPSP